MNALHRAEAPPPAPEAPTSLFRKEARAHIGRTLEGEVRLARPLRWSSILLFLAAALLLCVAISLVAIAPSTERISGRVQPGSAAITVAVPDPGRQAGSGELVVRSPVAGRLSSLTARTGDHLAAGTALAVVIPSGSRPTGEFEIPPHLVGWIRIGQTIDLKVDALSPSTYGYVGGEVVALEGPFAPRGGPADAGPVYRLRIAFTSVPPAARPHLVAGMALSATIEKEDSSLFRAALNGLFGAGR